MDPVTTLLTVPGIVALVNLGKRFGLSGPWAALAAVLLGVGLALFQYAAGAQGWYPIVLDGLQYGLAAAGLYDLASGSGYTPERAEEA